MDLDKLLSEMKIGDNSLTNLSKQLSSAVMKKRDKFSQDKRIKKEINDLIKEKQETESRIAALEQKVTEKQNELDRLKDEPVENKEDPFKYEAKLFRMITKITWDLDAPEGFISGYTTAGGLKTFNIDTTKHSEYFIVNHLWDLCSGDDKVKDKD